MLPGESVIREFESLIEKHCNKNYAIATCNASVAILGTFHALGLKGKEVVTTPWTWPGAIAGLLMLDCSLKFCKVEQDFLTMDPDKIEDLITEDTKAVFSADFLGYPCKIDKIQEICKKHNILLIHDASSSFGSYYKGYQAGYYADVTVYSFGRRKLFSIGEGGAIVTNNENIYKQLLKAIAHPERHQMEYEDANLFALNTSINLLAAEYGVKNYSTSLNKIQARAKDLNSRFNKHTARLGNIDFRPNFHKILLKTDDFNTITPEEEKYIQDLSFQEISYTETNNDNVLPSYKVFALPHKT